MAKNTDMYCPHCFGKLDLDGDCWIPCEYESNITTGEGYVPPLNRKRMITEHINSDKDILVKLKYRVRRMELSIKEKEDELKILAE